MLSSDNIAALQMISGTCTVSQYTLLVQEIRDRIGVLYRQYNVEITIYWLPGYVIGENIINNKYLIFDIDN